MKVTASIKQIEGFRLEGLTHNNKKVVMDKAEGGEEASPAQLLLMSLGGCTMMDCIHIITKARKKIEKFEIKIEAEEAETFPKVYTHIHLTYIFQGEELDSALIERAIKLSEEKYCRVHAMLNEKVKITSSYILNEET
ncbi:MAG: OsmC family protein [Ignavibacteria bacterium]|nr:OsmC family protein [Ignavibacteria bacterium]